MELESIVPWGRSYDEYIRMFSLLPEDLTTRILGCGDGPAAFNGELTTRGGSVTSLDPIYAFAADEIEARIAATAEMILREIQQKHHQYLWEEIPSPEILLHTRREAMARFLRDYPIGREEGRYVAGALPELPFTADQFDLVLCSHLLFTYSHHLNEAFHINAVETMLGVGRELRVFPVLQLDGSPSPHLEPLCAHLDSAGYHVRLETVAYEFQRGGNRMLRIQRPA